MKFVNVMHGGVYADGIHDDIDHHNILIENNIFDGPSGRVG